MKKQTIMMAAALAAGLLNLNQAKAQCSGLEINNEDKFYLSDPTITTPLNNMSLGHLTFTCDGSAIEPTGANNTAVGVGSGQALTSGERNTIFGSHAGNDLTTGASNVMIGYQAGANVTTEDHNVHIGPLNGRYSTGSNNTFIGSNVASVNAVTGDDNVLMGFRNGYELKSGAGNTTMGTYASKELETGSNNLTLGNRSGFFNEIGSGNVLLGAYSGFNVGHSGLSSEENVMIGLNAGYDHESGSGNVFIGNEAGFDDANPGNYTASNTLVIANEAGLENSLIYGDFSTGKLAIGTNDVTQALTVRGHVDLSWDGTTNTNLAYRIENEAVLAHYNTVSGDDVLMINRNWNGSTYEVSYEYLSLWGKVGIGTNCVPNNAALAVNGKIIAEEIEVKLSNSNGCWPDYVFCEEYNLKSLEEVESFIHTHGHLPNIPSANEVEKNGINVGDMNVKLMEKVEELTLYIIEQNKRIEQLETNMSNQNSLK